MWSRLLLLIFAWNLIRFLLAFALFPLSDQLGSLLIWLVGVLIVDHVEYELPRDRIFEVLLLDASLLEG